MAPTTNDLTTTGEITYSYADLLALIAADLQKSGIDLPDMGETGDSISVAFLNRSGGTLVGMQDTGRVVISTTDVEGTGTTPAS